MLKYKKRKLAAVIFVLVGIASTAATANNLMGFDFNSAG